jgi:hypothetical protein
MLMKMSGHVSVRSLGKYARPSAEALARWRAETDPAPREAAAEGNAAARSDEVVTGQGGVELGSP